MIYAMLGILIIKLIYEGLPWSFFYDALFKEETSDEDGEAKGKEHNHKKSVGGERKKTELCDARVITMDELMEEL